MSAGFAHLSVSPHASYRSGKLTIYRVLGQAGEGDTGVTQCHLQHPALFLPLNRVTPGPCLAPRAPPRLPALPRLLGRGGTLL